MTTTTTSKKLTMIANSHYIPKKNDAKPNGDDAHFFCKPAQVIAVADGVGGWSKHGIDAGIYARTLMRYAKWALRGLRPSQVDPMQVLTKAFRKTNVPGSSTACIISLVGDTLRAANLGDSGFMVMRGGKTVYRSPVQQKGFNYPYQLGRHEHANRPDEAEELVVKVECGDVIIAGTDGLFDNLFLEDIESIVNGCLNWGRVPRRLAKAALRISRRSDTATPFEAGAYEAGETYFGGKYDDITVVAARLVPEIASYSCYYYHRFVEFSYSDQYCSPH